MLNKNKKEKIFTRRIFVLAGIKASLFLSLIARLYYLQIVKSSEYKTFSDSNRIKSVLIPPLRGKILDNAGDLLASNRNFYRILYDPETASKNNETIQKLADVLNLDETQHSRMLDKIKNHNSRRPLQIHEHLSWNDVARVEVNAPDLPGVSIDVGQIRHFPTGETSSHVIGYMGPVSEKEIKMNSLLNHPDFKIGREGIEKAMEQTLRGKAGVKHMEVNAYGLMVRELSREESQPGENIQLTINKQLQEFIGKRMEGLSGCSVVMNIESGNILSFVSTPGFAPNEFTYGVSQDYWQQLTNDPDKPLINKAISNQYPPGSTFKLIVTLAALKHDINPDKKIYCPGYMDLGRTRFHCWKKEGHGYMDMKDAIMHSCNTYFYNISKKIGIEAITQMANQFGLGKEMGLILSGEKPGLIPSKKWKKKKYNSPWQQGDTLNVGIGQGYVLTTPIQLALMVSRVASGKMVTPNLIKKRDVELESSFADMDIPKKHLALLREGMRRVVNTPGGTAFGSHIRNKKYSMAGKTGTSQVISKKGLESVKDKLTKEELKRTQNHALFVGFGPVKKPKYAISVVVEHGGGGSKAAAPIARDIMEQVQQMGEA